MKDEFSLKAEPLMEHGVEVPALVIRQRFIREMIAAHIPSRYHRDDFGLSNTKTPNAAALTRWIKGKHYAAWAREGGLIEFTYGTLAAIDEVYLLARALLNSSVPVMVLSLDMLRECMERDTTAEMLYNRSVLVIPGFAGTHWTQPIAQEMMYRIQELLLRWSIEGKALILQGDCPPEQCKWWPKEFIHRVRTRAAKHVLTFNAVTPE